MAKNKVSLHDRLRLSLTEALSEVEGILHKGTSVADAWRAVVALTDIVGVGPSKDQHPLMFEVVQDAYSKLNAKIGIDGERGVTIDGRYLTLYDKRVSHGVFTFSSNGTAPRDRDRLTQDHIMAATIELSANGALVGLSDSQRKLLIQKRAREIKHNN